MALYKVWHIYSLSQNTAVAKLSIQQNPFGILCKTQPAFGKPKPTFFLQNSALTLLISVIF